MVTVLRLAVVAAVVVLIGRAAAAAWRNRRLAFAVWRRIRLRHVAGCLALLVVVGAVAFGLMRLVPVTGYGLGTPLGLSANAIFAPLQEATQRGGAGLAQPPPWDPDLHAGRAAADALLVPPGSPPWLVAGMGAFLVLLLALFPWLAYVEEHVFREGLETVGPLREAARALWFGLLHLIMLIPIAAALAIGVAGFAYGRVYRHAYHRASRRAQTVEGPFGLPMALTPSVRRARAEAVFTSTVWHTTFNSLIVLLLLAVFLLEWLAGP